MCKYNVYKVIKDILNSLNDRLIKENLSMNLFKFIYYKES